jgi:predicted lipoprotein with Yx(FWY)xxD motif
MSVAGRVRASRLAATVLMALMVPSACGDDDDATTTGAGESATTTAPTEGASTVTVASTSLGDVLADGAGRTLYVFMVDEPGKSNCTGSCLQAWPRFTPDGVTAGDGVDVALLGTISVDGVEQATVGERPLYYFASDAAPGDVNGQGVGGNWWVVAPDGTPIEE